MIIPQRKGDPIVFDTDERPMETSVEKMAKLRPAFKKDGTVTAGNASGINDAAAALLLMSGEKAKELGLKPMAKIKACAAGGVDPAFMGLGPVAATRLALSKAGWRVEDLDLIEANEAFAVQALAVGKELRWDENLVNVNGGAIAIGHPLGASAIRITLTLMYELRRRGGGKGIAAICGGLAQGEGILLEGL